MAGTRRSTYATKSWNSWMRSRFGGGRSATTPIPWAAMTSSRR